MDNNGKAHGRMRQSALHLLWREPEHQRKDFSRADLTEHSVYAWSKYFLHLLGVKYYLLESSHCPLDAMSPSENIAEFCLLAKHTLYWHTLLSPGRKSHPSFGVSRSAVLNGWSLNTATACYNSIWACVQQLIN